MPDRNHSADQDVVLDRTRRFLDYLGSVARELKKKAERDLRQAAAGTPLWQDSVPAHHAVALGPAQGRDAWLTVKKVNEPPRPALPKRLADHVEAASLNDLETGPVLRTPEPPHEPAPADDCTAEELETWLAQQQLHEEWLELGAHLQTWTHQVWKPWALSIPPARAARALYSHLFDLSLLLKENQATHELTWGHSVLGWQVGEQTIFSPVITTRMTIESDSGDGTLRVLPERSTELELDALEGLGIPAVAELAKLRERLRSSPLDPWLEDSLQSVNLSVLAPLGLDAKLNEAGEAAQPDRQPALNPTWVLYPRKRALRQERFYQELADVIDEKGFIPEGVAAIVADEETITADREAGSLGYGSRNTSEWTAVADFPLLPLPSNDDQDRIIRQLGRSRGVTVQGPPGTGKTHTIANLVSHLVAHGKRVLVTAQKEQALEVLRDKIPEELRDLSVAALGSSPEAIDQVHSAVQAMSNIVSRLDVERETRKVAELKAQIEDLRIQIRQSDLKSVQALRTEQSEFPLPTGPAKAGDVARWVHDHAETIGVIADRIPAGTALPLNQAERLTLHRLCRDLPAADIRALRLDRPAPGDLPVGSQLRQDHEKLYRMRDALADLEAEGIDFEGVDRLGEDELSALADLAATAAERVGRLQEPWLLGIRTAVRDSPDLATYWDEQARQLQHRSAQLIALRKSTVGHTFDVPTGDVRTHHGLLDQLEQRIAKGKGVPKLFNGPLREFHQKATVDDGDIRTIEELNLVRTWIDLRAQTSAALRYVQQLADECGMPVPAAGGTFTSAISQLAQQLQDALVWENTDQRTTVARLRTALSSLGGLPDPEDLANAARLLHAAADRRQERALTASLESHREHLELQRQTSTASPLWDLLYTAYINRSWHDWDAALEENARLSGLLPDLEQYDRLLGRLTPITPRWAERLVANTHVLDPGHWQDAWVWAQADTWLQELRSNGALEHWQQRGEALRDELSRTVVDMARRSAEIGLKHNLRDGQRRALKAWLGALGKVGKGTGKMAPHWQETARQQMPEAMGAVPVWIMPIHRVLDNFDPRRSDLFDVVIVDESSQCDLLSVGVLALGQKVVVVGDDKQTSPPGVGVLRERIVGLQQAHLDGVPQKELLTVDESLYGIAERAYGDVVMLREHFRCVPEIIDFSNRFYDNRILPLREKTRDGIGPALRAVHVPDGALVGADSTRANRPEAAALVQQVVECAGDPAYEGLSFGVVVLLSGGQQKEIERQLKSRLGLELFQKLNLRVGDAAAFQGDERDVIFVSVVTDHHRYAAVQKRDKQAINVAASRARDQLWVFHTVDPATLNAEDQRRALIDYARSYGDRRKEAQDLRERCDSGFERDVLDQLLAHDYKVSVQHRVGGYRIDMVVHGEKDRLAVECDGDRFHGLEQWDDDLRRQRVLERLGWKFWRVLASTYYRSPGEAFAALVTRLNQLGITPIASTAPEVPSPPVLPTADLEQKVIIETPAEPVASVNVVAETAGQEAVITIRPKHDAPDVAPTRAPAPETSPKRVSALSSVSAATSVAVPALTKPAAVEVPVPSGYRLVGWIRPHEAAAALSAHRHRADTPIHDETGKECGIARFHSDDSPEAQRYRSNVEVRRRNGVRERIVAWLKEAEATAIVQAADAQHDVRVHPDQQGQSGFLVQYFAPESAEAKTYRSTTRLLRTSI
ncbi:AAA family ATPase [Kineosporia rhizophila]|uniref:AAA domain-containing protein n=1 Tax=Kineosporia rhizophila TaxID=84633 RepID=UPI001E5312DD|nr:AAA family ATPase [Kineosporia rhizophila]